MYNHTGTQNADETKTSASAPNKHEILVLGPNCVLVGVSPMIGLLKMILSPVCQSNRKKI